MILDWDKIDLVMARKGATPRQIAKSMGLKSPGLSDLRSRKHKTRPVTVGRLAKALKCDPAEIVAPAASQDKEAE